MNCTGLGVMYVVLCMCRGVREQDT